MVDTCQFDYAEKGKSLGKKIIKILLAAMDKALDNEETALDESSEEEEEEDNPYKDI
jgi:hypothetical protein